MHRHVSFNLQIFPAEKTFLAAISSAALYGRGVFTTIAIDDAKPFLWKKHWRRLNENSVKLGINLNDFSEEIVKVALLRIISHNKLETGRARLTFFDESAGGIWNFETENKTNFLITTANFQSVNDEFNLTVSPFHLNSKSPLANVKSCNYLENLLALEDAKRRGFDEAVRLNERGEIASAATANIFWVKNAQIYTPPIETGCLAGTMREFLMENFTVEEKIINIEELFNADEIFLTSSGIGVKSVKRLDEKPFAITISAELKKFIQQKFHEN